MAVAALFVSTLTFHAPLLPPRPLRARPAVLSEVSWASSSTGLQSYDVKVGDGDDVAAKGSTVKFNFKGSVVDGQDLDSGDGVRFEIGAVDVVPGWEEGLTGMRAGGVRKLRLPPSLWESAKGNAVTKGVPDDATLEFELSLVECKTPSILEKLGLAPTKQNKILGGLILAIGVYEGVIALNAASDAGDAMVGM